MATINTQIKTFGSVSELNEYIKENNIKKKTWTQIQVGFTCSICGKEESVSISNFKRKFADKVLCHECHKKSLNTEKHYHKWTDEEKKTAAEKRRKTCLERYGVEYASQTQSVIDGVKNASKSRTQEEKDKMSAKRKQTCLERFGAESPIKNAGILDKIKQTCLERYGTENPAASDEVKSKIQSVFTEKYGGSPFNCIDVQMKKRNTMLERYGTEYSSEVESVAQRIKETHLSYGEAAFIQHCKDNDLEFIGSYKGTYDGQPIYYKCKCLRCGNIIEIAPHNHNYRCVHCYGKNAISSFGEKELLSFVKSVYNDIVEENTRRVIGPLELDIFIPEKNLAIEFDGDYWHSELFKDKQYHKQKSIACEEKGVHLIHISEYEWVNNKDKLKSIIKSFLVQDSIRVFARKCNVKEITPQESAAFCRENHQQGSVGAAVHLGLFYEGQLIEVETFGKPRFSKKYEWELVRECSKSGVSVVGGKSKLFKHFVKVYSPKSIVSYCDAAFFSGDSYLKCGMQLEAWNDPGYVWVKGHNKLSRYECQKHKLVERFPELKDFSESEIMHHLGYVKMFDCGQKLFVYKNAEATLDG